MPNYNQSARAVMSSLGLGLRVDRATADLPQTATGGLFTVVGGRVAITAILGEVTTAIQNQACNTKLISTPSAGTAVDLCAVTSIANKEVGSKLSITGLASDALVVGNAGAAAMQTRPVAVGPGVIGLNTAANNTGKLKWSIFYLPIDDGAYVEAA